MAKRPIVEQNSVIDFDEIDEDDLDRLPTVHADTIQLPTPSAPACSRATSSVEQRTSDVWLNLRTNIFHRIGGRWFGKTKLGEIMSRNEALGLGYRAASNG